MDKNEYKLCRQIQHLEEAAGDELKRPSFPSQIYESDKSLHLRSFKSKPRVMLTEPSS